MGNTRCAVCVRTGRRCSDVARGRVLYLVHRDEDLHLLVEELHAGERVGFLVYGSPEQRAEVADVITEEQDAEVPHAA